MTADNGARVTSHEHRPLNGPPYTHGHATLPDVPHDHYTADRWLPEAPAATSTSTSGLDRAIAAAVRRQELDRWQRDARAAGPRSGRCDWCGQDTGELWPNYGRWECEECYWTDGTPRERAAAMLARELGGDPAEWLS